MAPSCGVLHRINTNLIATNWDDILRVAGSLKVGTVHAFTLVQALQRGGHPTTWGRAIAELGRIPKPCTCSTFWTTNTTAGVFKRN